MISKSNYFKEVKNIDYKALPEGLKEGFDIIESGSMNYTVWKYLEQDKEFLELYFKKLNEFVGKAKGRQKGEVVKAKGKKAKGNASTSSATGKAKVPKAKAKGKKAKVSKAKVVKAKGKEVEKVPEEIKFIKRFVLINGKVKTKKQVLLFINALQKAIMEKRIRKTCSHAKEIIHVQEQLVKLYNEMPEQIKVEIDAKTIEKYAKIGDSEKALLSITYIKRYISLHGKSNVKEKAKKLMEQLEKAVKSGKLLKDDPYENRLESVYAALKEYIAGKTKTPKIAQAELNGLKGILKSNKLFSKKKAL